MRKRFLAMLLAAVMAGSVVNVADLTPVYAEDDVDQTAEDEVIFDTGMRGRTYSYTKEEYQTCMSTETHRNLYVISLDKTATYQWYVKKGENEAEAIEGAVQNEYFIPAVLEAGTYSYYCELTAGDTKVTTQTETYIVRSEGEIVVNVTDPSGEVKGYPRLQEAAANVKDGAVIQLLEDYCLWSSVEFTEGKIKLDLNGHTITQEYYYDSTEHFSITISDMADVSIDNGEIVESDYLYTPLLLNGGNLTLGKDLILKNVSMNLDKVSGVLDVSGGTAVIDGASFTTAGSSIYVGSNGTLVVNDGSFAGQIYIEGKVVLKGGSYAKEQSVAGMPMKGILSDSPVKDLLAEGYTFYSRKEGEGLILDEDILNGDNISEVDVREAPISFTEIPEAREVGYMEENAVIKPWIKQSKEYEGKEINYTWYYQKAGESDTKKADSTAGYSIDENGALTIPTGFDAGGKYRYWFDAECAGYRISGAYKEASVSVNYYHQPWDNEDNYVHGTKVNDWYCSDVVISAEDYKVSKIGQSEDMADLVWEDKLVFSEDKVYDPQYIRLRHKNGGVTQKITIPGFRIDQTGPSFANGGITIDGETSKTLLDKFSFDRHGTWREGTIVAEDSMSGVADYYYYIDAVTDPQSYQVLLPESLVKKEFKKAEDGKFELNSKIEGAQVVYAYAVDNAGNRSGYICTDGFVTDWTRPVVNLEDRKSTDVTTDLAYSFSEECTYEYVLTYDEPDISPDSDLAGIDSIKYGKGTITAEQVGKPIAFPLKDLTENTCYYMTVRPVDKAGNVGECHSLYFYTDFKHPYIAELPKLSGTYGDKLGYLKFTGGKVYTKEGGEVLAGRWEVYENDLDKVLPVGTTETVLIAFLPEDKSYMILSREVVPEIKEVQKPSGETDQKTDHKTDPKTEETPAGTNDKTTSDGSKTETPAETVTTGLSDHDIVTMEDGTVYKVISAKKKEAAFYKASKKAKGSVKIASSVTLDGTKYKVTEVSANAFKNRKKVTKITVPATVTKIGKSAFGKSAKLKKITIKSKKLTQKSIASGAFKGIKKNTVILVQKSKRTTYRKLFVKKGLNKKITVKAI